jgi:hypothetical protein
MHAERVGSAPPGTSRRAPVRRRDDRVLEVEVIAGGDPARTARMLSAMVNNSPMALREVVVGDQSAYPVPSTTCTRRGPMVLRLRLRDRSQVLDGLLVAEVVEIIGSLCRVVDTRVLR